jgi:hypothetical protein
MTTIAATLTHMAADRFVTYGPSYNGDWKIWVAKGAIWGAAGDVSHCAQFKLWTLGKGPRPKVTNPEDEEAARMEVLQLTPKGLFLWINDGPPDAVREHFYAIGSGAGYALGALSMGSTLEQAIEVSAKWDNGTRLPFDVIPLADVPPKVRKR